MAMVFAPTMLRDDSRGLCFSNAVLFFFLRGCDLSCSGDRPSLSSSYLERDLVLFLLLVSDKI
jgi:hypothetical protein